MNLKRKIKILLSAVLSTAFVWQGVCYATFPETGATIHRSDFWCDVYDLTSRKESLKAEMLFDALKIRDKRAIETAIDRMVRRALYYSRKDSSVFELPFEKLKISEDEEEKIRDEVANTIACTLNRQGFNVLHQIVYDFEHDKDHKLCDKFRFMDEFFTVFKKWGINLSKAWQIKNKNGKTPLEMAERREIFEFLMSRGAVIPVVATMPNTSLTFQRKGTPNISTMQNGDVFNVFMPDTLAALPEELVQQAHVIIGASDKSPTEKQHWKEVVDKVTEITAAEGPGRLTPLEAKEMTRLFAGASSEDGDIPDLRRHIVETNPCADPNGLTCLENLLKSWYDKGDCSYFLNYLNLFREDYPTAIKLLSEHNADVDKLLAHAAARGCKDSVDYLLEKKATLDPELLHKIMQTTSTDKGLEYLTWIYEKAGKSYEELAQDAAKYNNIHALKYAIKELGVDPNKKDDNEKNMLLKYLSYGAPKPIKKFLREVVNQESLYESERELIAENVSRPCYTDPYMLVSVYRDGHMYTYTGAGGSYSNWKAGLP